MWRKLSAGLVLTVCLVLPVAGTRASPGAPPAGSAAPDGSPTSHRFIGTATLNGLPAPYGTSVVGTIGGNACGQTTVQADSTYVLTVPSSVQTPGCGTEGAAVNFWVAGLAAGTGTWHSGTFTQLDLSATSGPDTDGDGVPDSLDNCPADYNPGQENSDSGPPPSGTGAIGNGIGIPGDDATIPNGDSLGDACDDDLDNDGLLNSSDTDPAGDITYDDNNDGAMLAGGDDGPSWDSNPADATRDGVTCTGSDITDTDGDGLKDRWETCKWGTCPDGTAVVGLLDCSAVLDPTDTDGDGLGDCTEAADVNGDTVVDFVVDLTSSARAFLRWPCPGPTCFGRDGDFDLNGNGIVDWVGDVIGLARFVLVPGLCK